MIGEEGDHYIGIIDRIHATWQAMPKTYETLNPPKSEADAGRADLDFSAGNPAAGEAREKARPHRTHPGASPAVTRRRPAAIPSGRGRLRGIRADSGGSPHTR